MNATEREFFAFDLSFPPNITDSQPSDADLWMLVATKVSNYHALGAMLGLKFRRVEMIEKKHRGDPVLINMVILTTWIEEETKRPTTWVTLIRALRDMGTKTSN